MPRPFRSALDTVAPMRRVDEFALQEAFGKQFSVAIVAHGWSPELTTFESAGKQRTLITPGRFVRRVDERFTATASCNAVPAGPGVVLARAGISLVDTVAQRLLQMLDAEWPGACVDEDPGVVMGVGELTRSISRADEIPAAVDEIVRLIVAADRRFSGHATPDAFLALVRERFDPEYDRELLPAVLVASGRREDAAVAVAQHSAGSDPSYTAFADRLTAFLSTGAPLPPATEEPTVPSEPIPPPTWAEIRAHAKAREHRRKAAIEAAEQLGANASDADRAAALRASLYADPGLDESPTHTEAQLRMHELSKIEQTRVSVRSLKPLVGSVRSIVHILRQDGSASALSVEPPSGPPLGRGPWREVILDARARPTLDATFGSEADASRPPFGFQTVTLRRTPDYREIDVLIGDEVIGQLTPAAIDPLPALGAAGAETLDVAATLSRLGLGGRYLLDVQLPLE